MNSNIESPRYQISEDGTLLQVQLAPGPFDASCLKTFKDEIERIWKPTIKRAEIDFSEASFIDSPMVGALLSVYKRIESKKPLVILNPNSAVSNTLLLFQMDSVFQIRQTRDCAEA